MPSDPSLSISCLNGDERPVYARGLCASCYTQTAARVRRGETTWEAEEKKGKAAPKRKRAWAARWWKKKAS